MFASSLKLPVIGKRLICWCFDALAGRSFASRIVVLPDCRRNDVK